MNIVDLMGEVFGDSFDINCISYVIEWDVVLSYLFLKFINNLVINKCYKIIFLKYVFNYMGEVEIKKFIVLLSLINLGDEKLLEIIYMFLVRVKFFDLFL